jgi:hypothetical protein
MSVLVQLFLSTRNRAVEGLSALSMALGRIAPHGDTLARHVKCLLFTNSILLDLFNVSLCITVFFLVCTHHKLQLRCVLLPKIFSKFIYDLNQIVLNEGLVHKQYTRLCSYGQYKYDFCWSISAVFFFFHIYKWYSLLQQKKMIVWSSNHLLKPLLQSLKTNMDHCFKNWLWDRLIDKLLRPPAGCRPEPSYKTLLWIMQIGNRFVCIWRSYLIWSDYCSQ